MTKADVLTFETIAALVAFGITIALPSIGAQRASFAFVSALLITILAAVLLR